MQTNYDVDYFIKKFEAIPEEMWCINALHNGKGQHCALGHCITGGCYVNDETKSLVRALWYVVHINNGNDARYQQPTPKQRVLAALYDIKYEQLQEFAVEEAQEIINNPKEETIYANV